MDQVVMQHEAGSKPSIRRLSTNRNDFEPSQTLIDASDPFPLS